MDPGLIRHWLHGLEEIATLDEASVALARERARSLAGSLGLPRDDIERAALIASELGTNQLAHARHGRIAVVAADVRGGMPGIEIVAADHGPGIVSPREAFQGVPRSSGSLGVGLAGVRRMATELDVDVRLGEGTCVRARVWGGVVARSREVGVFGRPCSGELLSGDHAWYARRSAGLIAAIVDGLGHGPPARDASDAVVEALMTAPSGSVADMLDWAAPRTTETRGVALTLVAFDPGQRRLEVAGVGNVTTRVESRNDRRSFQGTAGVLGGRGAGTSKAHVERIAVEPMDVVFVFSDGLTSRTALLDAPELLHEHPIVIAEHLMATFGRTTDDAMVVVIR